MSSETSTFIERWTPDWLDRLVYRASRFFRKLSRAVAYARFGWGNHDFDSSYLLEALHFKLQRMQKFMVSNDAYSRHDKETLQSLRLATRLAKKLADDEYGYFSGQHTKKWGPLEMKLTPAEPVEGLPDGGSVCEFSRPHANTEEEQAQEFEEFKATRNLDYQMRARDARWLFSIMEKYHQHWWD